MKINFIFFFFCIMDSLKTEASQFLHKIFMYQHFKFRQVKNIKNVAFERKKNSFRPYFLSEKGAELSYNVLLLFLGPFKFYYPRNPFTTSVRENSKNRQGTNLFFWRTELVRRWYLSVTRLARFIFWPFLFLLPSSPSTATTSPRASLFLFWKAEKDDPKKVNCPSYFDRNFQ